MARAYMKETERASQRERERGGEKEREREESNKMAKIHKPQQ
jgi:hypothetical protein